MPQSSPLLNMVRVRIADSLTDRTHWDEIIAQEHYLHSARMIGEQLRYVAEVDGSWIALLGWSAATLSSASRRQWIGWTLAQERQRLHLITQNARFLIRGEQRVPNLASRILGLCTGRLRRDWRDAYGHDLLLAETFVDASRYQGTCYRAAGWHCVGVTSGHARKHSGYQPHGEPKLLLMKELAPKARLALCAEDRTDDRAAFMTMHEIAIVGPDGLLSYLRQQLPDPRQRQGRSFQMITILGLVAAGMLTGRRSLQQIGLWASGLDQPTLELFCCPRGRDRRWKSPGANTMRYLMKDIDQERFQQAVSGWLRHQGLLGAVAGVSTGNRIRPSSDPAERRCPWHLRWTRQKARSGSQRSADRTTSRPAAVLP